MNQKHESRPESLSRRMTDCLLRCVRVDEDGIPRTKRKKTILICGHLRKTEGFSILYKDNILVLKDGDKVLFLAIIHSKKDLYFFVELYFLTKKNLDECVRTDLRNERLSEKEGE